MGNFVIAQNADTNQPGKLANPKFRETTVKSLEQDAGLAQII